MSIHAFLHALRELQGGVAELSDPPSIQPCMQLLRHHRACMCVGGELRGGLAELCSDDFLYRWMRARKFNVEHCFKSICSHAAWRVEISPEGSIQEVGGCRSPTHSFSSRGDGSLPPPHSCTVAALGTRVRGSSGLQAMVVVGHASALPQAMIAVELATHPHVLQ